MIRRRSRTRDARNRRCGAPAKKVRHVLSVGPYDVEDFFSLSTDDRLMLFGFVVTEADVWMMEIR